MTNFHPVNRIDDARLAQWATGMHVGKRNACATLMPLSPEDRYTVVEEAKLRMAYHAGWNFSGAVSQAVVDLRNGQTPCLDRWREEMGARENA